MLVTQSGHLPKTVGSALAAGSYAAVGGALTPDSKELASTTFMSLLFLADTETTASLDLQVVSLTRRTKNNYSSAVCDKKVFDDPTGPAKSLDPCCNLSGMFLDN